MNNNKFYFFLTFWVIAISGNPAINVLGKEFVLILSVTLFIIIWAVRPNKLTSEDKVIVGTFVLLVALHAIIFGTLVVSASLGFLIKLVIALLSIRLIPEFSRRYVSVIYLLSIISLVFFIPLSFGVNMQELMAEMRLPVNDHFHIGIYNLREEFDGSIRNMGMFWEPGAFAGYLILALFFLIRDRNYHTVLSTKGLVIIVTLLSTQSTTGYVAFMVLVILYSFEANWMRSRFGKWILIPLFPIVFISFSLVIFSQASFLSEKITNQIKSASYREDASRINRFGNFLYDVEWIAERPIIGWSANPETRASSNPEVLDLVAGQGNGLTGFTVRFGLIGLILFLGLFANNTRRIAGARIAAFGGGVVCILLTGEQFLNFPIFLTLMFLPHGIETLSRSHSTSQIITVSP